MLDTLPDARTAGVPVPSKLTHALAEYDGADPLAVDSAATLAVPLNVKLPDEVTVPLKVKPLAVPVPLTDVTVPVLLVNPLGFVAA
jgi:hypothetical protein